MDISNPIHRQIAGGRLVGQTLIVVLLVMSLIFLFSATRLNGRILTNDIVPVAIFVFACVAIVGSQIGVTMAARSLRDKLPAAAPPEAWLKVYMQIALMRIATLEAGGMLLLMGYFLTKQEWVLIPVPALMVAMYLFLPGVKKFEDWSQRPGV